MEPLVIERTVYSLACGYAGTLDLYARAKGVLTVLGPGVVHGILPARLCGQSSALCRLPWRGTELRLDFTEPTRWHSARLFDQLHCRPSRSNPAVYLPPRGDWFILIWVPR